jgi:hypothetical protein
MGSVMKVEGCSWVSERGLPAFRKKLPFSSMLHAKKARSIKVAAAALPTAYLCERLSETLERGSISV